MQPEKTIAEGIAIAEPIRGRQIVDAVRKTGGAFVTVSEREILTALVGNGQERLVYGANVCRGFCRAREMQHR